MHILQHKILVKSIIFPTNTSNVLRIISGWKCKRRGVGLRLGRNSCLLSALSGHHHYLSQQGVHTDSWEICSGLQLYNDECKNTNRSVYYDAVGLALVHSCSSLTTLSSTHSANSQRRCIQMLFRPSDIYHENVTYYMYYDRYIWIVPGLLDKVFF
jgi:hypothetical protein